MARLRLNTFPRLQKKKNIKFSSYSFKQDNRRKNESQVDKPILNLKSFETADKIALVTNQNVI